MTAYIWGIVAGNFEVKAVYNFIKNYWNEWFPTMPTYQNFNRRINTIAPAIQGLYALLVNEQELNPEIVAHVLDSMPIIVANSKRSGTAKSASELCDKGYCASKSMYYYGVKLHTLGQKQYKSLPKTTMVDVSSASQSDITVAKDWLSEVRNLDIYADKIYADKSWRGVLAERNVRMITPIKKKKGQDFLSAAEELFSTAVSRARQPIESFFSWLNRKTRIQHASSVRSSAGLVAFIFARLAASFFFYS